MCTWFLQFPHNMVLSGLATLHSPWGRSIYACVCSWCPALACSQASFRTGQPSVRASSCTIYTVNQSAWPWTARIQAEINIHQTRVCWSSLQQSSFVRMFLQPQLSVLVRTQRGLLTRVDISVAAPFLSAWTSLAILCWTFHYHWKNIQNWMCSVDFVFFPLLHHFK